MHKYSSHNTEYDNQDSAKITKDQHMTHYSILSRESTTQWHTVTNESDHEYVLKSFPVEDVLKFKRFVEISLNGSHDRKEG
jgi:hypothetical protein